MISLRLIRCQVERVQAETTVVLSPAQIDTLVPSELAGSLKQTEVCLNELPVYNPVRWA